MRIIKVNDNKPSSGKLFMSVPSSFTAQASGGAIINGKLRGNRDTFSIHISNEIMGPTSLLETAELLKELASYCT